MLSFESPAVSNVARMTSREIADLVGSRHDNVKKSIERLSASGVIRHPPMQEAEKINNLGLTQKVSEYVFTGEQGKRDSIVVVAQLSPEFTARLVDRWQALEKQLAGRKPLAMPDFSNPAEAARAWADQYDARLKAEQTKAQIGSRREATAMATASAAVRQVSRLQVQLDQSKQFATVKRVEALFPGHHFDWRMLKSATAELGLGAIDVFDQNYGTVKAYPAEAWLSSYAINIADEQGPTITIA